MAEIQNPSADQSKKRKKLSTRVDLTPMVDLGFLLITFFIFTTNMSKPRAMKLNMPKDTVKDSSLVKESETINIVLGAGNTIFYYGGKSIDQMNTAVYTSGIRKIITDKRRELASRSVDGNKLTVLIKPMHESSYKNVVDVLDEMMISQVKTYILMEPAEAEIKKAADLRVRS
jgi:biopolymer transport protein ExbD